MVSFAATSIFLDMCIRKRGHTAPITVAWCSTSERQSSGGGYIKGGPQENIILDYRAGREGAGKTNKRAARRERDDHSTLDENEIYCFFRRCSASETSGSCFYRQKEKEWAVCGVAVRGNDSRVSKLYQDSGVKGRHVAVSLVPDAFDVVSIARRLEIRVGDSC